MQNFLGDFECALDSKGRMMIPAKFRHLVPEGTGGLYVITRGKENCLNLYPLNEWNEVVVARLHELPPGPEKRQFIRFFSRQSRTLNLDKSGRIAVPPGFLELIGNPKRVVVVGVLNYMEIWAPEDYEKVSGEGDDAVRNGNLEI